MSLRKILQPWPMDAAEATKQVLLVSAHSPGTQYGYLMLKNSCACETYWYCFSLFYFFTLTFIYSICSVQVTLPHFPFVSSPIFTLCFCSLLNSFHLTGLSDRIWCCSHHSYHTRSTCFWWSPMLLLPSFSLYYYFHLLKLFFFHQTALDALPL